MLILMLPSSVNQQSKSGWTERKVANAKRNTDTQCNTETPSVEICQYQPTQAFDWRPARHPPIWV